jgi:fermentation-respiration switch protein FrsA (DUF1100 family)
VALVLIAVATVSLAAIWGFQRRFIYFPGSAAVPPAAASVDGARDVRLETSDGLRLGAWYVPARRSVSGPAGGGGDVAVLVAHGNGGDRAGRAPLADALADAGLAVLLFDYRGYGGNPGTPSEDGLARDVRAARAFLLDEVGVPAERLLYLGESLGAAVVAELATAHPPAGLLLRSPFADLPAMARVHYPWLPTGVLLRERYPVLAHVARVTVPTTVVYGTEDRIVPPDQSQAVADAAAGPTRVVRVPGADHNDPVLLAGTELVRATVELADRAVR